MTDYSKETVVQLKALLKAKGLSVDGKKAELLQRLVDSEASTAPVTGDASEQQPEAVPETSAGDDEPVESQPKAEEAPSATEATPAVTNGDADVAAAGTEAETPVESVEPEAPKVLSPEERKQLAVELLTKKIHRAEKFGDEASVEAARKDLARVEKFGVELGTALAREIGLVDTTLGDKKFHRRRFNNGKKKNNNKVGKAGRGGRKNNR